MSEWIKYISYSGFNPQLILKSQWLQKKAQKGKITIFYTINYFENFKKRWESYLGKITLEWKHIKHDRNGLFFYEE